MMILDDDVIAALQALQVKYDWNLVLSREAKTPKKVLYAVDNEYAEAEFDSEYDENIENNELGEGQDMDGWIVDDVASTGSSESEERGIYHDSHFSTPQKPRTINKGFSRKREQLTADYFKCYNEVVFGNKLPADLPIKWNKRMLTTAGYARLPRTVIPRTATIELSTKVNDTEERLRSTLLHEMCHAAAWIIDAVIKPPHGATFRKWADRAEQKLHIPVTTCHSYDIHKPHTFKCCNSNCGKEYARHTKRSINIETQQCGVCSSSLTYVGAFMPDGTPKKARELNAFSLFVKEHYSTMKQEKKLQKHTDVMKALSTMYATMRIDIEGVKGVKQFVDENAV